MDEPSLVPENRKRHPIRVFLSSTWHDLMPEREAVQEAINRMGLRFIGMEFFGSKPCTPLETCIRHVAESDFFVLVIGHRYGATGPSGSSYVEAEYLRARQENVPCFVYMKDEQTPVLPAYVEQEPKAAVELRAFKDRLKKDHVIAWFSTPADLGAIVSADLHKFIIDTLLPDHVESGQTISLSDIIPRSILELVLAGLSQRLGIPIGIFTPEPEGDFYCYPEHLHFNPLCRMFRENQRGSELCRRSDLAIARECMKSGKPAIYKCHAGFTDFAVPIVHGDLCFGVIFGGQVVLRDDSGNSERDVVDFAREIGERPEKLLTYYREVQTRDRSDLERLMALVTDVASYFCRLAREKSVYAAEASSSLLVCPGREDSYAWEMMTPKELIATIAGLTEEEFTLRLLLPCLERAGFENVQYCHGRSEYGCDLTYQYHAPMGELIRYGAQVKMRRIALEGRGTLPVTELVRQADLALGCRRYDELSRIEVGIDQFWVVSPYDLTENAKKVISDRALRSPGQGVYFLAGQALLGKLKRHVPVLLDRLVCERKEKC